MNANRLEVICFRLSEDGKERGETLAKTLKTPFRTLLREWTLQRIEEEEIKARITPVPQARQDSERTGAPRNA
ncbi:hypothetical protein MSSIT_3177 [Methanosarcina siciliae T4/M]|uniref:Uncharacterized protein n=1 Tax=Methanosarcina siciliae T4/M TaxID=1434120 RepID=A0A0E3L998_9EURY|nr:hypothetical protein [Methanosarcina siciliae]AKB29896.1 hypothetical protein MSSIT_3177 [Methanosarcina siciliae T4/M]